MKPFRFIYIKHIVIIGLLLISAYGLTAITLKAQIINSKSQPVTDVSVTDGHKRTITNNKGEFRLITQSDSLIISKLGYERRAILVRNIGSLITIKEKPIILAPVRVTERYEYGNTALDKTVIGGGSDGRIASPAETLLKESSLHSSTARLMGESQTLSLLGNLSRHTLVMLDGVPLNPHGEAFDLSSLPLGTIRLIKIVKGNASVYGGSSAIGGIIFLYTNNESLPVPLTLEHETSYGSFEQQRQNYVYEQKSDALSFRVSVSRQSAENDFKYKPRPWWLNQDVQTRRNNSKQQQDVSFKLSSNTHDVFWIYNLDAGQLYRELPGPVDFLAIYKNAFLTGQSLRQNLNLMYRVNSLSNTLILWQNKDNTKYNNTRATNPIFPTAYKQNHSSFGLKGQFSYNFDPADLQLGLETTRQSYELNNLLRPAASIDLISRRQDAFSLKAGNETQGQYLTNQMQAGIRVDNVTDFGAFTSWRIEELVKTDTAIQLQVGATLGNSFSLPSYYDMYWKGDAQSLGNPELEPETSIGGSVWTGISYRDYFIKAAYYQSEVKKLIQWQQTYLFGPQWKPVNIGKAAINNWEFELKTKPFDWIALNSSLTLTQAKNTSHSEEYYLTYTPDTKWTAELVHTHKAFTFILNLNYTGKQWTTTDQLNKETIASVMLYNSSLKYNYVYQKLKADIYLQLNNLFDKQYEIYAYVPQPGFNWLCGVTLRYDM